MAAESESKTSEQNPSPAIETVSRYSYYGLSVLTFVNFLNYIDRQALPAVAPAMQRELGLTDTELGAMEAALLLSFTILAPMFGRLGDRYSRTKLMAAAAVVWSIATGLTALVDRSPFLPPSLHLNIPLFGIVALSSVALGLCAVRALVGIGESSYSTITPTLIADYFPLQRRATALGVFQAAIPMGFALGYVLGAVLAHYFGWRLAFMIVGLPGVIISVFVWKLREPVRGEHDAAPAVENSPRQSWWETTKQIFMTRDWLLSTAGYTALTFVLGAFATWATLMLARDKHMSETGAAVVLGSVTLLAGATGTFGGGWIADRVVARRRNGYFLVCAASSLLAVIPAVIALVTHRPLFFLPAIFFAVVLLFVNNAPFHAILVNSVPPAIRASAMALNIVVIHACGDVISRFGVGKLSDSLAAGNAGLIAGLARMLGIDPTQEHLTAALLVVPAGLLISAVFFLWGARKTSV
ncbi:MAG: transporter, Spinster family, sphingosine-phosphate transporter [Blastocatellia bacterium]|jgi:MFS family permease|nr:transporter, Spinster family, sphingosine-phosphate transporter [Blastocatellia bacterium]